MSAKLGMKKAHREHVIRNAACSLILFEQIEITEPKSKVVKSFADKVLSSAKAGDLPARRKVLSLLFDKKATDKIFSELNARYETRASGFVRSFRIGKRIGDNAQMIRLELVDKKVFADIKKAEKAYDKSPKPAQEATEEKIEKAEKSSIKNKK